MAKPTKAYRLTKGTHSVPNPSYNADTDEPEQSHKDAQVGDVVMLNDDQFRAFRDKFVPVESEATDVRDADTKKLADAKAQAAKTGQNVNPNV
jgi:hypothetical protein